MGRRLIILRHAKSDWNTDAGSDHERPLNDRGRRSAPLVGAHLETLGWVPEVVLSSDATRTRQTWEGMASAFGDPRVEFTRALYLAGPAEVRAAIGPLSDDVTTAMVIGHNHGWEDVVYELTGVRVRMTTCNAALLTVPADSWSDASARSDWTFETVVRPKEI